jgi:hypothetical protein
MKSGMKLLLVAAALGVAGLANACSRDTDATRSLAGPHVAGDITEGARVRGHLTRTLQAMGPGGAVRAESTTTESFEARVPDDKGAVESRGPLVALARARPAPRVPVSFTDSAGHRHEIAFESGADGEPARAVRTSLDGRPFARVEFTWRHAGRGFILAHRSSTFFARDGSPAAREEVTADVSDVASAGALERGAASLAGGVRELVLPTTLLASPVEMVNCLTASVYYVFASLGVAVGITAVLEQPWNPKAWLFLGGAIKAWDSALDAVLPCWM